MTDQEVLVGFEASPTPRELLLVTCANGLKRDPCTEKCPGGIPEYHLHGTDGRPVDTDGRFLDAHGGFISASAKEASERAEELRSRPPPAPRPPSQEAEPPLQKGPIPPEALDALQEQAYEAYEEWERKVREAHGGPVPPPPFGSRKRPRSSSAYRGF
jgi:hypothetical protein